MKHKMKYVATLAAAIVLAGCGGGAAGGDEAGGDAQALYAGYFRPSEVWYCSSQNIPPRVFDINTLSWVPSNERPQVSQGFLVDDSNKAYMLCGKQLYVAQLQGNVSDGAGQGSASFAVYQNGKGQVDTATMNGAILTATNSNQVSWINFYDTRDTARNNSFTFKKLTSMVSSNGLPVNMSTLSYDTLAGTFADDGISISIDINGMIAGTSDQGAIAGRITSFNQVSGVHKVSITFTPDGGAPVTMTGVLGPVLDTYMAIDYSPIMIAVTGAGRGYVKVAHKMRGK